MRPPTSSRAFFRIYPFVRARGFAVSIQPSFIQISEDAERHSLKWRLQLHRNLQPNAIKADRYTWRQVRDNGGKNTPDHANL